MQSRRALVTGSARGIGRAVAERLRSEGYDVVGVDIKLGDGVTEDDHNIVADLGSVEDCRRIIETAGEVDILVNNAALLVSTDFETADIADFDRQYAVNLRAPVVLSRSLVPAMARRGWGRLVNISTAGVHTGGMSSQTALYASSKAGLHTLTRYVARVYGHRGVTANAIAPAWIQTEMGNASKAAGSDLPSDHPLRREADASEVAAVVAFLCGDDASYITGAVIDVNGGWIMR